MNESAVVRISQLKLHSLILSQLHKQASAIPGFDQSGVSEAAKAFAAALYTLFEATDAYPMSDEDALTALGFVGEAFESIASDLCEAHFAEES